MVTATKKGNKGYIKGGSKEKEKMLVDVKLDAVGEAADKFINLKEEKDSITEDLKKAEQTLITELYKANRKSITVKGHLLTIQNIEEKIRIRVSVA